MEKKGVYLKENSFLISEEEKKAFSKRLESVIPNRGLSEFARNAGIAESTIRSLIRGSSLPRLDNLISIANTAGITIEWLATGRGPKTYSLVASEDAVSYNVPDKPLKPGTDEYETKIKAIGQILKHSRNLIAEASENTGYTPEPSVLEGLKTLLFFSFSNGEITVEGLSLLFDALKNSTQRKEMQKTSDNKIGDIEPGQFNF